MTRQTVAALATRLSTGDSSDGTIATRMIINILDSYLDLDTYEAYKASILAGTAGAFINREQVLWSKTAFDMNVTTDQAFTKAGTFTSFLITRILFTNASTSLTTAVGGIYDTASKGGVPLVAAAQAYSTLTGATLGLDLTLAAKGRGLTSAAALYLALSTPQGGAATADGYVIGIPLS